MNEENLDLFSDVDLSLEELSQCLRVNKKDKWESTLVDALDLAQRYFIKKGFDQKEADIHAIGVVRVMSDLVGGQPLYFPSGKKLEAAIRNNAIYNDFGKLSIHELVEKYKLTKAQLYNIYAEQRALPMNRKPKHPDLFSTD